MSADTAAVGVGDEEGVRAETAAVGVGGASVGAAVALGVGARASAGVGVEVSVGTHAPNVSTSVANAKTNAGTVGQRRRMVGFCIGGYGVCAGRPPVGQGLWNVMPEVMYAPSSSEPVKSLSIWVIFTSIVAKYSPVPARWGGISFAVPFT